MDHNSNKIKLSKYLFRVIIILLFLPMIQARFKLIKIAKLEGYVEPVNNVSYTKSTWFSGEYQEGKEKFLKTSFGFANWAIRLDHQLAFSAYGMPRTHSAIVGKNGYLYQIAYIETRLGLDFMGKEAIAEIAKKTKLVQDTLRALGKSFFFVIAPNKADFYPEHLPEKYEKQPNVLTNYDFLLQAFKDKNINHLDINSWFLSMKDTSTYPLFPKTGIHYSSYGAALVAKKIIAEVEQQSGKDLPELYWDKVILSDTARDADNDVEKILNLIFRISTPKLAYPQVQINAEGKYKPKAIAIGDSFYWQLMYLGLSDKVFDAGVFLHHMKEVHPGGGNFLNYDMAAELKKTDVLYIIMTPYNFKNFAGVFIDNLYNFYFKGGLLGNQEEQVKAIIEQIKNTPEWLAEIEKKAKVRNIPVSEMIYLDAKYVVDENAKSH